MRGGAPGGRGGMRGMNRGGLRGRARGGAMRGALSLRGVFPTVYSILTINNVSNPVLKMGQGYTNGCALSDVSMCCTGKRVPAGVPVRGRGSASRLAMRRGGRHRGGIAGRGGALTRGVARGGVARGQG